MSAVYGKTKEGLHICIDATDVSVAMYMNHTIDIKYKHAHNPAHKLVFQTKKAARDFYAEIVKHMGAATPVEVGDENVAKP